MTKTKKASSHSENLNATALYERRFYYETEASCSHDQGVLPYALRTAKKHQKTIVACRIMIIDKYVRVINAIEFSKLLLRKLA